MVGEAILTRLIYVVAEAALKTTVDESIHAAGQSGRLPDPVASVAREASKAGASALLEPILRRLLRLSDETVSQLDLIIREPLITGLREAATALATASDTSGDSQFIADRLRFADGKLSEALSFCRTDQSKGGWEFYITIVRGLIAYAAGANAVAQAELRTCLQILDQRSAVVADRLLDERANLRCCRSNLLVAQQEIAMMAKRQIDSPISRLVQNAIDTRRAKRGIDTAELSIEVLTQGSLRLSAMTQFVRYSLRNPSEPLTEDLDTVMQSFRSLKLDHLIPDQF